MSEEEKEAIEEAKKQIEEAHNLNDINVFMTDSTTLKTLLNYIEKLQKENKNADERNYSLGLDFIQIGEKLGLENFGIQSILSGIDKLQKENEEKDKLIERYHNELDLDYVDKNFISKDKTRNKIKEIESYAFTSEAERDMQDYAIIKLEELLGE